LKVVQLLRALRTIVVSLAATATGLARMATGHDAEHQPQLHVGDAAPDFTLEASDHRTYRLRDLFGRGPIVIAWFPKAFTGG
jgi:peroxiredoxin Q/BCP